MPLIKLEKITCDYTKNIARGGQEPNSEHEEVKNLEASIAAHGQQTPIIVREISKGKYEVVAGYTRFWIAVKRKAETIDAIITEKTAAEAAALENGRNAINWAGSYRTAAGLREEGKDLAAIAATMVRSPSYIELLFSVGDRIKKAVESGTLPHIVWDAPFSLASKLMATGEDEAMVKLWNESQDPNTGNGKGKGKGKGKGDGATKVPPFALVAAGRKIMSSAGVLSDRWQTDKLFPTLGALKTVAVALGITEDDLVAEVKAAMTESIKLK